MTWTDVGTQQWMALAKSSFETARVTSAFEAAPLGFPILLNYCRIA